MNFNLKKIFFNLLLNSTLFLILIIGIQNYSKRSKVNFIVNESINLPIGFIVGISFISGSITGGFLTLNIWDKD